MSSGNPKTSPLTSKDVARSSASGALLPQVLATIAASWNVMGTGIVVGFSSPTLPQLTDVNTTDFYFSQNEAALYSSLPNLGAVMGCALSTVLHIQLGKRLTMLIFLPVMLGSWFLVFWTPSIELLLCSRFVTGVAMAILLIGSTMYIPECVHHDIRGTMIGVMSFFKYCGMLVVYGLGATSLTWRELGLTMGLIMTIPPFVAFLFLPDSPRWLAATNQMDKAEESLFYFRRSEELVEIEMKQISKELESQKKSSFWRQLQKLKDGSIRERFIILFAATTIMQFGGNLSITSYAVPIFQTTGANLDPFLCSIYLAVARVLSIAVYTLIADKIGRHKLYFLSQFMCGLSCIAMGAYFLIKDFLQDLETTEALYWLPLLSMITFIFNVSLSNATITLLRGEILPNSFRSCGLSLLVMTLFLGAFGVTQAFPKMSSSMHMYGTFWFYAAMSIIVSFIPILTLPETKGLSLEEIEAKCRRKENKVKLTTISERVSGEA